MTHFNTHTITRISFCLVRHLRHRICHSFRVICSVVSNLYLCRVVHFSICCCGILYPHSQCNTAFRAGCAIPQRPCDLVFCFIIGSAAAGRYKGDIRVQRIGNDYICRCTFVILITDFVGNQFPDLHRAKVFCSFIGQDFLLMWRFRHRILHSFESKLVVCPDFDRRPASAINDFSRTVFRLKCAFKYFYRQRNRAFIPTTHIIERPSHRSAFCFTGVYTWFAGGYKFHICIQCVRNGYRRWRRLIILIADLVSYFVSNFNRVK